MLAFNLGVTSLDHSRLDDIRYSSLTVIMITEIYNETTLDEVVIYGKFLCSIERFGDFAFLTLAYYS